GLAATRLSVTPAMTLLIVLLALVTVTAPLPEPSVTEASAAACTVAVIVGRTAPPVASSGARPEGSKVTALATPVLFAVSRRRQGWLLPSLMTVALTPALAPLIA